MSIRRVLPVTVLSAFFLYLSHPNFISKTGFYFIAYFFIVPMFFILRKCGIRRRLFLGAIFGITAFGLVVKWLFPLSVCGGIAFTAGLTTQTVIFFWFYPHFDGDNKLSFFAVPSLWVLSEFIRTVILGGFGWNLSYSQAFRPAIIQIAAVTGSYGISFFIILINYCIYRIISKRGKIFPVLLITAALSLCSYVNSLSYAKDGPIYRIAIVQGNIDAEKKWNEIFANEIFEKYKRLTLKAAEKRPDIILWPETALPGDYGEDTGIREKISSLVKKIEVPMLVGAPISINGEAYNSALLFDGKGDLVSKYIKNIPIPFCEYLPFEDKLAFLKTKCNFKISEYTPGKTEGLMPLDSIGLSKIGIDKRMGIAICSEDFYPYLIRGLVKKNAAIIINITNEALLKYSEAQFIHVQALIMRSVENRIASVRCSNTGWSCFVDKRGDIYGFVSKEGKRLFVEGFQVASIDPSANGTFYTSYGDLFFLLCFLICIVYLMRAGIAIGVKK